MLETQLSTIRRIRRTRAAQRIARLNRRVNLMIELGMTGICGFLLAGFALNLLRFRPDGDGLTHLLYMLSDVLILPFKPAVGYSTIAFQGGVFAPIYLIAAATYILVGLIASWTARQFIR